MNRSLLNMTACSPLAVISLQPHSWRLPPPPLHLQQPGSPAHPARPCGANLGKPSSQHSLPRSQPQLLQALHLGTAPHRHHFIGSSCNPGDGKIMSILPMRKLRPRKVAQTVGSRAPPSPRSAASKSNPLSQCQPLPLPRLLGGGGDSTRAVTEGPQGLPCHLHPGTSSALGPRLTP